MIKQHYNKIISIALALVLIVSTVFFVNYNPVKVEASSNVLSVSVAQNIDYTELSDGITEIEEKPTEELTSTSITKVSNDKYVMDYEGTTKSITIENVPENSKQKISISTWDEYQLDLTLDTSTLKSASSIIDTKTSVLSDAAISDKLISATDDNVTIEYKPTEIIEGFNEDGGLDILITLDSPIVSESLSFTYNVSGVTGYFQPALTQEYSNGWNDEFNCYISVSDTQVIVAPVLTGLKVPKDYPTIGDILCERPIHVVNSVAFYADKQGHVLGQTNYATGKIGHLYRMLMVGSGKGQTAWTDWLPPKNGLLELQLDEKALETFAYPITIKPAGDTFGYTSVGASNLFMNSGVGYCSLAIPSSDGDVDSISIALSAGSKLGKVAIYDASYNFVTNGYPGTYTSVANEFVAVPFTGTKPSVTASTEYRLTPVRSSTSSYLKYDSGGAASQIVAYNASYSSFPQASLTIPTGNTYNYKPSIYATYTPSASFDISNTPTSKAFGIVTTGTTYYAKGSAPSNPVDPSECTYTITNSGGVCDLDMKVSDFTGGAGWNIVSTSPSTDEVRITAYYEGQNPASGLVLTNSDQEFYDGLAASATLDWDFKMETGSGFSDGSEKTSTLTITARAET